MRLVYRQILAVWALMALAALAGTLVAPNPAAAFVRTPALVGCALLTAGSLVLALAYQHRYATATLRRRPGMVAPWAVWAMTLSYLAVLDRAGYETARRWDKPHLSGISISLLLADVSGTLFVAYLIERQIERTPEPYRGQLEDND